MKEERYTREMQMEKRVAEYIRENHMMAEGDRVVAAVSGGADSVCLLLILNRLKKELGIELMAVHVHHGLRGEEADRDARYVETLGEKLGIPVVIRSCNVRAYRKEHRLSEEEAGRMLRYQLLEEEADRFGARWIATAHHKEDEAETILYQLFRGSGLRGLGGIRPVRGRIIRPFLCVSRKEIERFLNEEGISYCLDSTNDSKDYTRNRIRTVLMPMICSEVNTGACEHILQAGWLIRQADQYLEKQTQILWEQSGIVEPGRAGIDVKLVSRQEEILKMYLIRKMIETLDPAMKNIAWIHIQYLLELLEKETGKSVDLPGGLRGRREYGKLWVERKEKQVDDACFFQKKSLPELEFMKILYKNNEGIPKNEYTKWFDYDKIEGTLSVRTRKTGDYIILPGGGTKKLKSYMIDEKIPAAMRDQIPVLAEENHVIWIIGYRISEYYKISEETKTILQVKLNGGENYGR